MSREKKPRCGEGWFLIPTLRLCGRRGLTRYRDYRIFAFKHLTVRTYLSLVLDFNKQLNCTCCVSYFRLKGIILSRDIFDYFAIIVEVNLEIRGFTKLTKSSLLLHLCMSHHHGTTAGPICPKFCTQIHLGPEMVNE